jgi:hypothetical protein
MFEVIPITNPVSLDVVIAGGSTNREMEDALVFNLLTIECNLIVK